MHDDFNNEDLDIHLLSPYVKANSNWASTKERLGYLRMHGRQSFFSRFDVSILAARVDSFVFTATTKVDFNPIHFSQSAGLILYYDNNNWLFARKSIDDETGNHFIDVLQAKKGKRTDLQRIKTLIPSHETEVKLKVCVNYEKAQFFYQTSANENFEKLGDELDITFLSDEDIDGFTAMMVGIGTWDAFRHESFADFDYFIMDSEDTK